MVVVVVVVVVVVLVVVVETKFDFSKQNAMLAGRELFLTLRLYSFCCLGPDPGSPNNEADTSDGLRFLRSRLSAVHFLCFKRIFSAQVWRCYSILGSNCVVVERSGVFFVSLELSSRRRALFVVILTFLVFVVWCPIAVFFAPVR